MPGHFPEVDCFAPSDAHCSTAVSLQTPRYSALSCHTARPSPTSTLVNAQHRQQLRRDEQQPASNRIVEPLAPATREPQPSLSGHRRRRWPSIRSSLNRFRPGRSSQTHQDSQLNGSASTDNLLPSAEETTPLSSFESIRPQRIGADNPATSMFGPFNS